MFWFWEEDSIEYEIFKKYEYALSVIGIDFQREDVQDALEGILSDWKIPLNPLLVIGCGWRNKEESWNTQVLC